MSGTCLWKTHSKIWHSWVERMVSVSWGNRNLTATYLSVFLGDECDIDINECDSNPCHHAGTCLDQPNGYTCHCPHGWVGANCEIREYCHYSVPLLSSILAFNRQIMLVVAGQPDSNRTVSEVWRELLSPYMPDSSPSLLIALCCSHSFLSLNPSSIFTGMRMSWCHPEFMTVNAAKKCTQQRSIRILSTKQHLCVEKHAECQFTLHLSLQILQMYQVSSDCPKRNPERMSITENQRPVVLSC